MSAADQAALTAAYVAQQRLLSTTLVRDLVMLLRALFGGGDPAGSWPGTKMALGNMVRDRHRLSADLAGPYYQRVRYASDVGGWARIAEPAGLDLGRLDATFNATGIATYQRAIKAGADPAQARDRMAVTLSGSASQLALEGGRQVIHDTVQSDDEAIGWARVSDGDPCAWCAMLISRGAIYRNTETAGRTANKRFVGDGMFKWHNHDGCGAVPLFRADDPILKQADDLYDQWLANTAGHSGKKAIDAWRQYWDGRDTGDGGQQVEQAG